MKKLLLIFATLLISLNSMALSFPRSAYRQQRSITQVTDKSVAIAESKELQPSLATPVVQLEEEASHESFIEMFANYIIRLFTEKIFQDRGFIAVSAFESSQHEYLAIKQDFDYRFIG